MRPLPPSWKVSAGGEANMDVCAPAGSSRGAAAAARLARESKLAMLTMSR
jgi:hypothetical protein